MFILSKKAAKIDEIFAVDLTLCSKCQIDGEDLVNFCGLLRKHTKQVKTERNFFSNFVAVSENLVYKI